MPLMGFTDVAHSLTSMADDVHHKQDMPITSVKWKQPLRLMFLSWKCFVTVYWKETELMETWGNCLIFLYEKHI